MTFLCSELNDRDIDDGRRFDDGEIDKESITLKVPSSCLPEVKRQDENNCTVGVVNK